MKNPDINKFKSPGKYLYQKFKYLKSIKVYKNAEEPAKLLGYNTKGGMYYLFSEEINVDLNKIKLFKKVFKLSKEDEERFCLLACYGKADSPFEKKLFRNLLNQQGK